MVSWLRGSSRTLLSQSGSEGKGHSNPDIRVSAGGCDWGGVVYTKQSWEIRGSSQETGSS